MDQRSVFMTNTNRYAWNVEDLRYALMGNGNKDAAIVVVLLYAYIVAARITALNVELGYVRVARASP